MELDVDTHTSDTSSRRPTRPASGPPFACGVERDRGRADVESSGGWGAGGAQGQAQCHSSGVATEGNQLQVTVRSEGGLPHGRPWPCQGPCCSHCPGHVSGIPICTVHPGSFLYVHLGFLSDKVTHKSTQFTSHSTRSQRLSLDLRSAEF